MASPPIPTDTKRAKPVGIMAPVMLEKHQSLQLRSLSRVPAFVLPEAQLCRFKLHLQPRNLPQQFVALVDQLVDWISHGNPLRFILAMNATCASRSSCPALRRCQRITVAV